MVRILRRFERFFKSPFSKGGIRGIIKGSFIIPPGPPLKKGGVAANCQGFSLMEVLVATTLMGLVMVGLLQVLTGAMRAQEASLQHARALQVAERALQESCNAMNLADGRYQGQDGPFSYQVQVTPQYEVAAPATLGRRVKCSLIQVVVSWEELGRKRSVSLETMRTASQRE